MKTLIKDMDLETKVSFANAYGVPTYETNDGFYVCYAEVRDAGRDGKFTLVSDVLGRFELDEREEDGMLVHA